ncbi:DUF58 domain-containing protein [Tumidithrix elongata RA019]|uniref:DUF58 domain-containing protein n=1 Tax=Tumidithrix elongata BACA0141 TaxID=2716417 RepID=A0AAW9Q810_9CYAN|nr:DUF58 domain-containing protein [Tumidithrix elongata RA019]
MKQFFYRFFRFTYIVQKWLGKRLTTSGMFVVVGIITSAVFGLDPNPSTNYQIFAALLSILAIEIGFSLFFRFRFSATRLLPRFGTVGMPLKYRIAIQNQTRKNQVGLKLFEDFADPRPSLAEFLAIPEPNEDKRNRFDRSLGFYRWQWAIARKQSAIATAIELPLLAGNRKTDVVGTIVPTQRGVVRLAGLTLACPGPLGLFHACKTFALPQSISILPKLYNLPSIQLPGSRRYQSGGVALSSSVGDSEEFRALREYRAGDSLRNIHWKSWAKVGKPIVKEEQDEFFVRHALILDTFQSELYSEIFEEAIALAASFAYEVQTQESLLDLMFVGTEAYCFTFGRGLSHTDRMLEILASVIPCQDRPFDSIVPAIAERISLLSGCICIFLAWDEERKKLVRYLQSVGIFTLVLIIASDSSQFSHTSELVSDRLTQIQVLTLGNIQAELMQL